MKTLKKISAWLMALVVMTCMMGTSVFAAEPKGEHPDEAREIKVQNVETGATVIAYQITEGVYNAIAQSQVTSFEVVQAINDENLTLTVEDPTQKEVEAIAKEITINAGFAGNLVQYEMKPNGEVGEYTAKVEPGSYIVLVSGTVDKIYNPMLLSVGYDDSKQLSGGTVDATKNFNGTGYAKSSEVTVKKTIDDLNAAKDHGTDALKGSSVPFKIETTIPSYSDKYTNVHFDITDTLTGLVLNSDSTISVKVGDNENVQPGTDTYTLTRDDKNIKISFTESYIRTHGGQSVVVIYNAIVPENANVNFNANTNDVTIDYTNNNGTVTSKKDKDYVYTFEINGELYKTDVDKTTVLPGAKFEITKVVDKDEKEMERATVSNATDVDGKIVFSGLGTGTYEIKEVTPPTGYQLSGITYMVKIDATYNDNGTLATYSIKVWEKGTNEPTNPQFNYTSENHNPPTVITDAYRIPNTKLASLPSTGGMGTYLFTIGGVALMAAAAAMFAMSRKNKVTDNK